MPGALVALGLFQLTPAAAIGEESWAMQLMGQLPELDWFPLLGLGAGCALVSPENLVFYAKEGGMLLTNHTSLRGDLEVGAVFVAVTTSLLLLPPLAWLLSGGRLRQPPEPPQRLASASGRMAGGSVRPSAGRLSGLARN